MKKSYEKYTDKLKLKQEKNGITVIKFCLEISSLSIEKNVW